MVCAAFSDIFVHHSLQRLESEDMHIVFFPNKSSTCGCEKLYTDLALLHQFMKYIYTVYLLLVCTTLLILYWTSATPSNDEIDVNLINTVSQLLISIA